MADKELELEKKAISNDIMGLRKQISNIDKEIDKSPNTAVILYKERYSINLKINYLRDKIKIIDSKLYNVVGYDGCLKQV